MGEQIFWERLLGPSDVFLNAGILQCTQAVIIGGYVENTGKLSYGERLENEAVSAFYEHGSCWL